MIDFNPSEHERQVLLDKLENEKLENYAWDFINEGTDASTALELCKAVEKAAQAPERWVCAVIGEPYETEVLVLEPIG